MLQRMSSIIVVGPKRDYQQIVDVLYDTGTIHLESIADEKSLQVSRLRSMEPGKADEIAQLLIKINGILQLLPKQKQVQEPDQYKESYEDYRFKSLQEIVARAKQVIEQLETTTRQLATRKSELELSLTSLDRYEKILTKIQPIEHQLPSLSGFEVTVLLIQKEFSDVLDLIKPVMKEITRGQFEFISADLDETTIAAITVFSKRYSEEVHSFLFSKNINEVRIPSEYSNMPLDKVLLLIERNRAEAKKEMKSIDERLARGGSRMVIRAAWQ